MKSGALVMGVLCTFDISPQARAGAAVSLQQIRFRILRRHPEEPRACAASRRMRHDSAAHPSRLAQEGEHLRMTVTARLCCFAKFALCACFQRRKRVMRYRPRAHRLDTIARIFEARADVGDGLPIDIFLGSPLKCYAGICIDAISNADDFTAFAPRLVSVSRIVDQVPVEKFPAALLQSRESLTRYPQIGSVTDRSIVSISSRCMLARSSHLALR